MWKIVGATIQGTSHIKDAIPCQDFIKYSERNNVYCIALADGAGSCSHSAIGAEIACQTICNMILRDFDVIYNLEESKFQQKLIHAIRTRVGIKAKKEGVTKSEFSSTLLFVAHQDNKFIIGHIGDGVIGYIKDDTLLVLSEPENGEFANTTYFFTTKNYKRHLRIKKGIFEGVKAFFLMSDGSAECLFHKKDKVFSKALFTISNWINEYDEQIVNMAIKENMGDLFISHTSDDCSLIMIQKST